MTHTEPQLNGTPMRVDAPRGERAPKHERATTERPPCASLITIDGSTGYTDPSSLYWAVVVLPECRPSTESLRYALEPDIPAPLESLETRFVHVGYKDGSCYVACAIETEQLKSWLTELDQSDEHGAVLSLVPGGIPDCVRDALGERGVEIDKERQSVLTRRLELREGIHEHRSRARRRVAHTLVLLVALLACSGFFSLALWRDARAIEDHAGSVTQEILTLATGALSAPPPPGLDPRLALGAELRRLRATRQTPTNAALPSDRTRELLALLAALPTEFPVRVDKIDLDQSTVSLTGSVRSASEFETLRIALDGFAPGWIVQTANTTRQREGSSFTLLLRFESPTHQEVTP